jgi:hypothetical protein
MGETRIRIRFLGCIFHGPGNSDRLCQNFGIISGGLKPQTPIWLRQCFQPISSYAIRNNIRPMILAEQTAGWIGDKLDPVSQEDFGDLPESLVLWTHYSIHPTDCIQVDSTLTKQTVGAVITAISHWFSASLSLRRPITRLGPFSGVVLLTYAVPLYLRLFVGELLMFTFLCRLAQTRAQRPFFATFIKPHCNVGLSGPSRLRLD